MKKAPISFGVVILENAYGRTCHVEAVTSLSLIAREKELVLQARDRMPCIMLPRATSWCATVWATPQIPCTAEDEETAVRVALRCCRDIERDNPKIIQIQNTLHPGYLEVSPALLGDVRTKPRRTLVDPR